MCRQVNVYLLTWADPKGRGPGGGGGGGEGPAEKGAYSGQFVKNLLKRGEWGPVPPGSAPNTNSPFSTGIMTLIFCF
jgi:hypothetical protein